MQTNGGWVEGNIQGVFRVVTKIVYRWRPPLTHRDTAFGSLRRECCAGEGVSRTRLEPFGYACWRQIGRLTDERLSTRMAEPTDLSETVGCEKVLNGRTRRVDFAAACTVPRQVATYEMGAQSIGGQRAVGCSRAHSGPMGSNPRASKQAKSGTLHELTQGRFW